MALVRITTLSKEETEKLLGGSLVFSLPTLGRSTNRSPRVSATTPEPSDSEANQQPPDNQSPDSSESSDSR